MSSPVWPPRSTHLELVGRVRLLVIDTVAEGDLLPEVAEPPSSSRIKAASAVPPLSPTLRRLADWAQRPVPRTRRAS